MAGGTHPAARTGAQDEYTRLGNKGDVSSNGFIHLSSTTHDTSSAHMHTTIKELGSDLHKAVQAVWPRRHDIRYTQVYALLLKWEDDDLGVFAELQGLERVFRHMYHYSVETFDIPNIKPERVLNRRVTDFLDEHEGHPEETLLIVYYAGHAARVYDSNEPPIWYASSREDSAAVPSTGTQQLLEASDSDVLLLFDCCHSAPTKTNRCPQSGKSVTEAISACGYETVAPEVDEHSFSKALIEELAAASRGPPFSVGKLHELILRRLKCWIPSLLQDTDREYILSPDGRLVYERQPRKTPIYSILCETEPRRSILLAPLKSCSPTSNSGSDELETKSNGEANSQHNSRSNNPFRQTKHPQILLSIRLAKPEIDIVAVRDCLRGLPSCCEDIKIEGVWESFSTLLIIRMPVAVWNLIPKNPAYSFVGYVTSDNMAFTMPEHHVFAGGDENLRISSKDQGNFFPDYGGLHQRLDEPSLGTQVKLGGEQQSRKRYRTSSFGTELSSDDQNPREDTNRPPASFRTIHGSWAVLKFMKEGGAVMEIAKAPNQMETDTSLGHTSQIIPDDFQESITFNFPFQSRNTFQNDESSAYSTEGLEPFGAEFSHFSLDHTSQIIPDGSHDPHMPCRESNPSPKTESSAHRAKAEEPVVYEKSTTPSVKPRSRWVWFCCQHGNIYPGGQSTDLHQCSEYTSSGYACGHTCCSSCLCERV